MPDKASIRINQNTISFSGNVCTSDPRGKCDTTLPCTGSLVEYNGASQMRTDLQKTLPPAPSGFEYVALDKNKIIAYYQDMGAPEEEIDKMKNTKPSDMTFDAFDIHPNASLYNGYYSYGCSNLTSDNSGQCTGINTGLSVYAGKYVKPPKERAYCAFLSDDDPVVLMNQTTKFIAVGVPESPSNPGSKYNAICSTKLPIDGAPDTNIQVTGTILNVREIRTDLQKTLPPAPAGFQYMRFDKDSLIQKTMAREKGSPPPPGGWDAWKASITIEDMISTVVNYQFRECSSPDCLTNPDSYIYDFVSSFVPINSASAPAPVPVPVPAPAPAVSSIPVAFSPQSWSPVTQAAPVAQAAPVTHATPVTHAAPVTQAAQVTAVIKKPPTTLPGMAHVVAAAPVKAAYSRKFYMILLGIVVLLLFMLIVFVMRRQSAAAAATPVPVYAAPAPVAAPVYAAPAPAPVGVSGGRKWK